MTALKILVCVDGSEEAGKAARLNGACSILFLFNEYYMLQT